MRRPENPSERSNGNKDQLDPITPDVIATAPHPGISLVMRSAFPILHGEIGMSITYIIGFNVRPAQRERFLSLLNGVLDAMRHEAMFVSANFHVDPNDPCHFLLHETWVDHQDVLDVQIKRPYREEWHAALDELLKAPRDISVWQPLRSDSAEPMKT
jgi:quinol monooxygenase YgiN